MHCRVLPCQPLLRACVQDIIPIIHTWQVSFVRFQSIDWSLHPWCVGWVRVFGAQTRPGCPIGPACIPHLLSKLFPIAHRNIVLHGPCFVCNIAISVGGERFHRSTVLHFTLAGGHAAAPQKPQRDPAMPVAGDHAHVPQHFHPSRTCMPLNRVMTYLLRPRPITPWGQLSPPAARRTAQRRPGLWQTLHLHCLCTFLIPPTFKPTRTRFTVHAHQRAPVSCGSVRKPCTQPSGVALPLRRRKACTKASRSPSSTPAALPVSTPVRRSFTILYGCST